MATSWVVRCLHDHDIEAAVQVAEDTRGLPDSTPLNLVDLISSPRLRAPAVVAVNGDTLIGFITANIVGDRATVTAMRIDPLWRKQGVGTGPTWVRGRSVRRCS